MQFSAFEQVGPVLHDAQEVHSSVNVGVDVRINGANGTTSGQAE